MPSVQSPLAVSGAALPPGVRVGDRCSRTSLHPPVAHAFALATEQSSILDRSGRVQAGGWARWARINPAAVATHEFLPLSCPALQDEGVSTGRYRTSVCALPLVNAPGLAAPVAQPVGEPVAAQ